MIKKASNKYLYLLALLPFFVVALLYEILPLATVVYKSFTQHPLSQTAAAKSKKIVKNII